VWSDTPADSQPSPGAVVVHLQYREVDYVPLAREIEVTLGTTFSKEPAFKSGNVFRGLFKLGADTNQFVPFAWDMDRQQLYLDLNRNRDLTDDPAGVLKGGGEGLQLFRSVRLPFPSREGTYQVLVDAHVFEQEGKPRVFLYVRSLWEGALELNGKKWYVAVIERADGRVGPAVSPTEISDRMVLRPWAEREQSCLWWHATLPLVHALDHVKLVTFPYRYAGNAEVFDAFNLPARLFFQRQAYRLDYRVERSDGVANLALSLTPVQAPLGKVHMAGEFIRRVVLDNGMAPDGFTAVLDRPAGAVEAPVGDYARQLVLLQREGFTNVAAGIGTNRLSVAAAEVARLRAGGPLTNQVEVESTEAGTVSLRYRLVNDGGMGFHLAFRDEQKPPGLEIRQEGRLVGSGSFEYG
jgi:hypothetical protein